LEERLRACSPIFANGKKLGSELKEGCGNTTVEFFFENAQRFLQNT
jgi:hypothetical protein